MAQAQLVCVALVILNLLVRAWRARWLLAGARHPVSLGEAVVLNAIGDAAAAVTPLRLGAEPARFAEMLRARVPAGAALLVIGIEVVVAWIVIGATGAALAFTLAPAWWREVAPTVAAGARAAWPWVLVVALASLAAWWASRRARPMHMGVRRPGRRMRAILRRIPAWPLIAAFPLTLLDVASRVAVLPVLAAALPTPPPLGPVVFGSFALLYSQFFLPTPSGAGAVELGFLGGMGGARGGELLLSWRVYTTAIPAVLGIALALPIYGRTAARFVESRWSAWRRAPGTTRRSR